jgi:hypothetical protein
MTSSMDATEGGNQRSLSCHELSLFFPPFFPTIFPIFFYTISPIFPRFSIISQTPSNFVHCLRSLSWQYSQVLGPSSVCFQSHRTELPFGYALPVPFVPDMHCQSTFFINFHEELQGCVFSAWDARPVSRPVKRY